MFVLCNVYSPPMLTSHVSYFNVMRHILGSRIFSSDFQLGGLSPADGFCVSGKGGTQGGGRIDLQGANGIS